MTDLPFKIHAWYVRDFKTIEVREVLPNGNHVVISGPNASGKTSHLDSILFALQGLRKGEPNPVRIGADDAEVILELSNGNQADDLTIRRTVDTDGKVKLQVSQNGARIENQKQGVIDTLLSKYMLNPIDFLKLRPQDQLDTLLALCSAPPPVEAVEIITGQKTPAVVGETAFQYLTRLSGDKDGHFYELRRSAKYEADVAVKALDEARETRRKTPEVIVSEDASQLNKDIAILEGLEEQRQKIAADYDQCKARYAAAHAKVLGCQATVDYEQKHIEELEANLAIRRTRLAEAIEARDARAGDLDGFEVAGKAARDKLAGANDCREQLKTAKINLAEVTNNQKAATEWTAACERVTQLTVTKKEADLKYEKLDGILEKLRDLRKKTVNDIDIGVSGLECGDGLLTVEGVPLPAASAAQQYNVACGIAIKQNPKLRLLRIDEGERLDQRSRMQLYNIADKNGCQVILTAVRDQPDLTVDIME